MYTVRIDEVVPFAHRAVIFASVSALVSFAMSLIYAIVLGATPPAASQWGWAGAVFAIALFYEAGVYRNGWTALHKRRQVRG